MIGIVVVSHSDALAKAAVELALQMAGDQPPPIEIAAGADGGLGTDATAVAAALERADEASEGSGVLVVTDLGSALLSAEMALEFVDLGGPVVLSQAPFVEGLVAAVVQAAMGRSLEDVEREASKALLVKAAQLGGPTPGDGKGRSPSSVETVDAEPAEAVTREAEIVNPQGLHARPAAMFAKAAADQPVEVMLTDLTTGQGPADAASMIELMALGVRVGHRVRLTAEGPEAADALATLVDLIAGGLGEEASTS